MEYECAIRPFTYPLLQIGVAVMDGVIPCAHGVFHHHGAAQDIVIISHLPIHRIPRPEERGILKFFAVGITYMEKIRKWLIIPLFFGKINFQKSPNIGQKEYGKSDNDTNCIKCIFHMLTNLYNKRDKRTSGY